MSKWMKHILWSQESKKLDEDHISLEDLASLMDGRVTQEEREEYLKHINQCRRCFDIVADTLKDFSEPEQSTEQSEESLEDFVVPQKASQGGFRQHKMRYTIAASIIFIVMITGALVFKYQTPQTEILVASLSLDQPFKTVLMENSNLEWNSRERIDRLAGLLRENGLEINSVKRVVLAEPYYPSKSFFGPEEQLEIRVEKGVVYISVVEK